MKQGRRTADFPFPTFKPGVETLLHPCAPVAVHGSVVTGSHYSHQWRNSGDGISYSVSSETDASFRVDLDWKVAMANGQIEIRLGDQILKHPVSENQTISMGILTVPAGEHKLKVMLDGVSSADLTVDVLEAVRLTALP